ncbi:hypothetical protein C0J52_16221 [Blattella germanica]|nr:hypothetical protein C0J52_16221 [Blattella germanica]
MLSVTESSLSLDKNLFQLTCIVSANDIRLSARTEVGQRQLLALVMGSGDLTFYYLSGEPGQLPIMRRVPWFADANKKITALCFDPSGCWLLVTGTDSGDLIFVSLSTGFQVGITYVRAKVSMLHICQDNNLDSVFLLWKLLLEQRKTGYAWPIDSSGSAVKVVTSNSELSSSSHNSLDLEYGNRNMPHLPTTRSRLQGLKQLSVEKLTNLRQRLAETRSKGAAAMAVNMHFRRESSGSSSDDTTGSPSQLGKQTTAEGTEAPVSHHVTTGPQPEKLSVQVGATFLCPQFAKGRDLLSGYYDPTSILTIHGMSLELIPLSVHKLASNSRDILVTDKFLYITDTERRKLSIVSSQLSESRLDGDAELNPDSIIQTYRMQGENEKILSVYKRTDYRKKHSGGDGESVSKVTFEPKSRGSSRERKSSQAPFTLPKSVKDLKLDTPSVDTCVIVTSNGVYEVSLRLSPTEVFMDLVLGHQALEKAEKLALVFGLNLQQLLEGAGDLKLNGREFPQAISLYKLSRCRHLKSVLKFAAGGHAAELLGYITLLFSTSGVDLTTSERIHLSNLAVMSYTEQVLRAAAGKIMLFKQFLKFLRENLHYDEVLAVNVAGQTGLWEVLQFLASFRGLHPERLAALYDPSSPQLRPGLKRMFKLSRRRERASGSYGSYSMHLDSLDLIDPVDELFVPCEDIVQTFLLVLLYLAKKRQAMSAMYMPQLMEKIQLAKDDDEDSEEMCPSLPVHTNTLSAGFSHVALIRNGAIYTWGNAVQGCLVSQLCNNMGRKPPLSDVEKGKVLAYKDQGLSSREIARRIERSPWVVNNFLKHGHDYGKKKSPGRPRKLSSRQERTIIRQLSAGTGPLMSRYSCPQQVSLMPSLKLEVISVSCGRQHTLALTNNGVYAWGSSQFGQLGIGKTGQSPHPRLVQQLCRERIIAVAAGQYHSIALADDGRKCIVVIQICGGHGHTIVLTAEGQVHTFGSSVFGQLGNGSNTKSSVPVHVASLTERITMVATSYFHNLAVSSTNKLYIWGSSPQVLRLQAQAQKKARLLQQQSCSTPPSPARNAQIKPEQDSLEASQTYHNPTFMDSELPVSSSQTSQPTNADKCQRNQSDAIKLGDNKVDSSHIPVTVNDPDVYRVPGSENSSVFSDFENANVGKPSSRSSLARRDHNLDLQGIESCLRFHCFTAKVKAKYTSLATTDEAYSIPTLIVSPTMEFKGLTASRSPVENNFDSGVTKTSNQTVKSDGIDDIQPHLLPQLIDTSLVVGPITQLGNGTRKEIVKPTPLSSPPPPGVSSKGSSQASGMHRSPSLSGIVTGGDKLRFRQVSCGCEFTIAQENTSTGKVWAWGNNSQAQLGHAPVEDSKPLEGKFVMLKTTKRVIKLPHGTQNSSDTPKEVPGLPSSTITFKYDNMSGMGGWYENWVGTSTELCPPLCSIEEPCYGLRTLHYAFQHFHGYYDSPYLSNKCLELENYQGAAKLAALDRHYHLALAYQLKALALSSAGNAFDLGKHIDTQCTNLNQEISQKISNFKKDLITNTANSNETKKTSTNFSEVSNGVKDTNFNPLIVDAKDNNSHISMTNGNSNYTELNENIGTNTPTQGEENIINHTSSQSKDMKATSESNGVCIMPNDKKTESEKVTKNPTEEVENRNKRNSEIHSNFTKSKENEVAMNDNSREKSRVGFVEKIHTEVDIESTNKTKDSISDMGVKAPEGKTEPSPSDEVTEEINSSSSISTPESLASTNAQDSEMHAFAVQGGTEQMSEGHRYLTSPDSSTSPLASEEQSLQSPETFLPQETPRSSDINLVPI